MSVVPCHSALMYCFVQSMLDSNLPGWMVIEA